MRERFQTIVSGTTGDSSERRCSWRKELPHVSPATPARNDMGGSKDHGTNNRGGRGIIPPNRPTDLRPLNPDPDPKRLEELFKQIHAYINQGRQKS